LQIISHKRATKYRALLRKMTYKDKGSYESSPLCNEIPDTSLDVAQGYIYIHTCIHIYVYIYIHTCIHIHMPCVYAKLYMREQYTATHCNTLQRFVIESLSPGRVREILQHTATHCNTLQRQTLHEGGTAALNFTLNS